jgi:hypothetical protein
MPKKYTREQFWKLYETLPQELRDALWSEETTEVIRSACERYGVSQYFHDVIDLAGAVLLGLGLPQQFQEELQELGIKKKEAEKIAHEVNRFVFYAIKPVLDQLHSQKEVVIPKKDEGRENNLATSPQVQDKKTETQEKPSSTQESLDPYRETLE